MPLVFLFQKLLGLLQRSRKLLSDRLDQVGGKSSFIVLTFNMLVQYFNKVLVHCTAVSDAGEVASVNDSSTKSSSADRA